MPEVSTATETAGIPANPLDGRAPAAIVFHAWNGMSAEPVYFADRLAGGGARVSVPTTLNVSSLDLLHPELSRGDPEEARLSRLLMERSSRER